MAHKAASSSHTPADLVKVSTRVLPVCYSSTQTADLLPKYIGPFSVIEAVNLGAIRLQLPDRYAATRDVFNVSVMRPCFNLADRGLDVEQPGVQGHPPGIMYAGFRSQAMWVRSRK